MGGGVIALGCFVDTTTIDALASNFERPRGDCS
jgi:hypothetical protein